MPPYCIKSGQNMLGRKRKRKRKRIKHGTDNAFRHD
jgi:hypothetical protein